MWLDSNPLIRSLISWLWVNPKGDDPGWAWPDQTNPFKESQMSEVHCWFGRKQQTSRELPVEEGHLSNQPLKAASIEEPADSQQGNRGFLLSYRKLNPANNQNKLGRVPLTPEAPTSLPNLAISLGRPWAENSVVWCSACWPPETGR